MGLDIHMGKLLALTFSLNPIPHELWKDVITRVWAIMAHKEKMAYNTYKKATNLSKLV